VTTPGDVRVDVQGLRIVLAGGSADVVDGVSFQVRSGRRVSGGRIGSTVVATGMGMASLQGRKDPVAPCRLPIDFGRAGTRFGVPEIRELLGLVGESGSGKTTVALALLGYVRRGLEVAAGRVLVGDNDMVKASEQQLQRLRGAEVVYIPQDPASALNPTLRIGTQLKEVLQAHRQVAAAKGLGDPKARLQQTLEEVGLGKIPRLLKAYPRVVVGIKDSSGDFENTRAMLRAFPGFEVFVGTEKLLLASLREGGAGCITATANVNAPAIARAFRERSEERQREIDSVRALFESLPLIAALKEALALRTGDASWRAVRPPLVELSPEQREKVKAAAGP